VGVANDVFVAIAKITKNIGCAICAVTSFTKYCYGTPTQRTPKKNKQRCANFGLGNFVTNSSILSQTCHKL